MSDESIRERTETFLANLPFIESTKLIKEIYIVVIHEVLTWY